MSRAKLHRVAQVGHSLALCNCKPHHEKSTQNSGAAILLPTKTPTISPNHHLGPRPTDKMATELTVQSERAFQKQPHSESFLEKALLDRSRELVRRRKLTTATP